MDKSKRIKVSYKTKESYIYKHSIERVWEAIKDISKHPYFNKGLSNVSFIDGKNSYDIGNVFSCKFIFIDFFFRVETVFSNDDFKQLIWYCIDSTPNHVGYHIIITLHKVSDDDNTLLFLELIFEKEPLLTIEQKQNTDAVRKEMLKNLDVYLDKDVSGLFQYESIIINSSISKVWQSVTNWELLKKLVPFIADEIEYKGSHSNINTELILKWTKKNAICNLKVTEINNNENDNTWCNTMNCYNGSPKPPLQNIKFCLFKLEQDSVFLEFQHNFFEPIKYDVLKTISVDKRRILLELRNNLESSI
jgi:hypothetical protein